MEDAALDHDKWLADNTFYCQRLDASISVAACGTYRAENQDRKVLAGLMTGGKTITIPGRCQGCTQAKGELAPPKPKLGWTSGPRFAKKKKPQPADRPEKKAPEVVPEPVIKEKKMANKKGKCVGPCGRDDVTIAAKGMCWKCYVKAKEKAGSGPGQPVDNNPDQTVAKFVGDCCLVGAGNEVVFSDLYDRYSGWCEDVEDVEPLSKRLFSMKVISFILSKRKKGNITIFEGLSLIAPKVPGHLLEAEPKTCRLCGCTEDNCKQCIEKTGEPCHWIEDDLCSACHDLAVVDEEPAIPPADQTKSDDEIIDGDFIEPGSFLLDPADEAVLQKEMTRGESYFTGVRDALSSFPLGRGTLMSSPEPHLLTLEEIKSIIIDPPDTHNPRNYYLAGLGCLALSVMALAANPEVWRWLLMSDVNVGIWLMVAWLLDRKQ